MHIVGNIIRSGDIQRKLNEKYREGYTLFSTTLLLESKHNHAGIMIFAMEKDQPFSIRDWRARESGVPKKYLEKYDVQPETKTKKGRKKKRR